MSEREQTQPEKLLYTVGEAADLLNLSRAHVYNYVLAGDLRSVTLGRARRIPASAIAEFVERLEGEGHLATRRRRVTPRPSLGLGGTRPANSRSDVNGDDGAVA